MARWATCSSRGGAEPAHAPGLPDTWSATRERRLEDRRPGHRLELAGRLGRSRLRDHRRSTPRSRSRPSPASTSATCVTTSDGAAPLDGLRHRLQDRQDPLGARGAAAAPPAPKHLKNSYASETPVTDGERVYAYFGNARPVRVRHDGQAASGRSRSGPFKTRNGWGTAASPVLHSDRVYRRERQRRAVVPRGVRQANRRRDLAREPRRGHATGRRRSSGRTSGAPRSSRRAPTSVRSYDLDGKLLWELTGMSTITHPDAVRAPRAALHQLGLRRATRCGRSTRSGRARSGDISLKAGETSERVHRLVAADARALQSDAARLRRLLLHAVRPRLPHVPRREDRQGDLRPAAHRGRRERLHGVAVGLQRQDLRAERGRRHVT